MFTHDENTSFKTTVDITTPKIEYNPAGVT